MKRTLLLLGCIAYIGACGGEEPAPPAQTGQPLAAVPPNFTKPTLVRQRVAAVPAINLNRLAQPTLVPTQRLTAAPAPSK